MNVAIYTPSIPPEDPQRLPWITLALMLVSLWFLALAFVPHLETL